MRFKFYIGHFPLGAFLPVLLLLSVAAFASVLSNNQPLFAWGENGPEFPFLKHKTNLSADTKEPVYRFALHAPVPYRPTDIQVEMAGSPPFTRPTGKPWYYTHWLGTDEIGRDVLAQLIHGCRNSVWVALSAMSIALLIGLSLGALGGFWHNTKMNVSPVFLIAVLLFLLISSLTIPSVYAQFSRFAAGILTMALVTMGGAALYWIHRKGKSKSFWIFKGDFHFSPDILVVGGINFLTAIPSYFALLALLAIWSKPSISGIALALGLLMWPNLARLTRSAIISLKQTGLAEGAESLGYAPGRVMFVHLLPNALQPALVALSFGIGGAIIAESFLSFIGIAPVEMTSWGTLLAKTRTYPGMWWLSVFPGLAILYAVLVSYRLANALQRDTVIR